MCMNYSQRREGMRVANSFREISAVGCCGDGGWHLEISPRRPLFIILLNELCGRRWFTNSKEFPAAILIFNFPTKDSKIYGLRKVFLWRDLRTSGFPPPRETGLGEAASRLRFGMDFSVISRRDSTPTLFSLGQLRYCDIIIFEGVELNLGLCCKFQ